jgi:hypothetical protein
MHDIAPIQIAALQAVDQYLGSGNVGGHGDVVHIAQAQQRHFVGFAGLCVDGITEEQQQVDLIAGDAGCDLLVAAYFASARVPGGQFVPLLKVLSFGDKLAV